MADAIKRHRCGGCGKSRGYCLRIVTGRRFTMSGRYLPAESWICPVCLKKTYEALDLHGSTPLGR